MEYVPTMPGAGLGLLQHTEDSFDRLMERLNAAHLQQVATLNRKVERLRRQLRNCVRRGYPLEEVSEELEVVDESSTHLSQDMDLLRSPMHHLPAPSPLAGSTSPSPLRSTTPNASLDMYEMDSIDGSRVSESFGRSEEEHRISQVGSVPLSSMNSDSVDHVSSMHTSRKSKFVFNSRNISAASYNPTTSTTLRQCETLLNNPTFEALLCFVIFLNAVVFALEAQNKGMAYGHIGFGGDLPDLFWSNGDHIFYVLEMVFGVVFTVEVVLRLMVRQHLFFCGAWNWLDLVIVLVWILGQIFEERLPVNSQVLRLARLIRLFRLLRLVRRIQQFDSLYLMSTAIRSSSGILGWTAALLFLIQMLFALVFNQLLYGFYFSDSVSTDEFVKDQQEIVYTYFGTFSRSLLTMFEITLANWPPVCRVLTENVSEWFMIFFLVHKVTMGFAVIGVINGVLMQETFKVASYDDTIMMRTKQKAMENHIRKMQLLFEEADTSEDGRIDLQEFKEIVADNELKAWLGAMELDIRDVGEAWDLLQDQANDNSGGLTAEQLVLGVAKLQGTAKSLDLQKVIKEQQGMMKKVEKLQKGFRILAEQCLPPSPSGASRINSESDEFVSF
ncbi:SCN8A [Symbiodinium sp. CCMP2592]|nr:SCN8A [Symbiodinium sp. CCMP2592]